MLWIGVLAQGGGAKSSYSKGLNGFWRFYSNLKLLKKKSAFTLTETIVMAAVIGIIAVISIVSLKGARPDR
ncbi:hypothetical protein IJ843_05465 [bacterium]|nr:hypothetical protein [bacterium]